MKRLSYGQSEGGYKIDRIDVSYKKVDHIASVKETVLTHLCFISK